MKTKLSLVMSDLTLGDMELFEQATGEDIMEVMKPRPVIDANGRQIADPEDPKGRPLMETHVSTKAFIGLVYLASHKADPTITVADVKGMKLNEIEFDMKGDADPLPDEAAAQAVEPVAVPEITASATE